VALVVKLFIMNLELKAIYFCSTNGGRWGKGLTPNEAKKNAGLIKKSQEKTTEFYVQAAVLDNPTEKELENLLFCITADNIFGSPIYYRDNRTEADTDMINAKHVGWLMIEKNF
jgi:hypothetical protein